MFKLKCIVIAVILYSIFYFHNMRSRILFCLFIISFSSTHTISINMIFFNEKNFSFG